MFLNHLKFARRNLQKHKSYALINIVGLSVGLASFILIALYVRFELSYDRFHQDHESIYRIYTTMTVPGGHEKMPFTADPLAPTIHAEWPQVSNFLRVKHTPSTSVTSGEHSFYEQNTFFADTNFFDFFDFELLRGEEKEVLSEAYSAVISEGLAEKYFKNEDPIGKIIKIERGSFRPVDYIITGISGAAPKNSHINFDLLLSFESAYQNANYILPSKWWETTAAYLKLNDQESSIQVQEELPNFIAKNGDLKNSPMGGASFSFTPLTSVHTSDIEVKDDYAKKQSKQHILLFSGVALLVLVLAIINYVNLSIVKSLRDSKQIGIHKLMGASRAWLVKRHIVESIVYCLFAVILALLIVEFVVSGFNRIIETDIYVPYNSLEFILELFIVILFIGVVSGIYPALYLANFRMADSLKDGLTVRKSKFLKSGLVVFQFAISQGLIIASLIVYTQLDYMMNSSNSGLDTESVMVLPLQRKVKTSDIELLKERLLSNPAIMSVSKATPVPGVDNYNGGVQGGQLSNYTGDPKAYFSYRNYQVDHDFKDALGMNMFEGRWYDPKLLSDHSNSIIINETAADYFGWGEKALGQVIMSYDSTPQRIVGIVEDFHTESFQYPIEPAVFFLGHENETFAHLVVKFKTNNVRSVIDKVSSAWAVNIQEIPFDYYFMDDYFESQYTSELRLKRLIISLSILAIFIAILGVYGLTSFTIQQRTKEFGIRKILGASIRSIALLLSKEVYKLILIAFALVLPITYYYSSDWLSNYAYRIEMSPVLFVAALSMILGIVWFSISSIMFKSAKKNPVDDLRYE